MILHREQKLRIIERFFRTDRSIQTSYPSSVRQGNHNTCAVAALESRLYRRSPSIVAELLRDAIVYGEVRSRSGAKWKVDAQVLNPDSEALAWRSGAGPPPRRK